MMATYLCQTGDVLATADFLALFANDGIIQVLEGSHRVERDDGVRPGNGGQNRHIEVQGEF